MSTAPTPTAVRLRKAQRLLRLEYADGTAFELPAELLRVWSPSAEVRGHGPGQRTLQTGKAQVNIDAVEAVGHYALRLTFDDGHDSGLYTWEYLHDLGQQRERYWARYTEELREAGASRMPPAGVEEWRPE